MQDKKEDIHLAEKEYFRATFSIHEAAQDIDIRNNEERKLNLHGLTYTFQSIIGSGGYRAEDMKIVMDIMCSHRWDTASIITAAYPSDRFQDALDAASDAQYTFNVVIRFDGRL